MDRQKVIAPIPPPPDYHACHKAWLNLTQTLWAVAFWKSYIIGTFANCTEWPQTELKCPDTNDGRRLRNDSSSAV